VGAGNNPVFKRFYKVSLLRVREVISLEQTGLAVRRLWSL